jgi:hypothetical protein
MNRQRKLCLLTALLAAGMLWSVSANQSGAAQQSKASYLRRVV